MHATDNDLDPASVDLGPLAWVLDELRKSLDGAFAALRRFMRDTALARGGDPRWEADVAQLRIARQQLHQAVGALEMVDLPGPAQVLRAMEAAVQAFIARPELCLEPAAAKVERSGFALLEFLQALLAGQQLSAVALFPQYRDVLELTGAERIHPADLWPIDWRWEDPPMPPATALDYGPTVRARLDQAVLRIVKAADPAAARELAAVCLGLGQARAEPRQRSFWKICAGCFDAFAWGLLPIDVHVKRAASRVLVQYAQLAKGGPELSDRLAQDLLFFCGQVDPLPEGDDAPLLRAVRRAWQLERRPGGDWRVASFGRFDPVLLAQVRKRIALAREGWSSLVGGELARLRSVADQFRQLGDGLVRLHAPLTPLAEALRAVGHAVVSKGVAPTAELAMETATAILYLEAALQAVDPDERRLAERARRLAERLDGQRLGLPPEPLEPWIEELYRGVSDRQTMGSVVGELRIALGELEKDLDAYFRAPHERLPLLAAPGRLSQMRGVLSVLGLEPAAQAVLRMREAVEALAHAERPEPARIESLANNLGALGFLIDMLDHQPSLAKKLFVYDDVSGELRPVMGRRAPAARPVDAAPPAAVAMPEAPPAEAAPGPSAGVPDGATPAPTGHDSQFRPGPAAAAAGAAPAHAPPAGPDDELLGIFLDEVREVVEAGLGAVQVLRDAPQDLDALTTIRRAFHTLKGSSRMVGLAEFGNAGWAMEQVFNAWLAEHKPASEPLRSLAARALQGFGRWADDIAAHADGSWSAELFQGPADSFRLRQEALALVFPGDDDALAAPMPETAARSEPPAITESPPVAAEAMPPAQPEPTAVFLAGAEVDEIDLDTQGWPSGFGGDFAGPGPGGGAAVQGDAGDLESARATPAPDEGVTLPAGPPTAAGETEAVGTAGATDAEAGAEPEVQGGTDTVPEAEAEADTEPAADPARGQGGDAPLSLAPVDLGSQALLAGLVAPSVVPATVVQAPGFEPADLPPFDEPSESQESTKVIGDLRIDIALYNVFLNEADEWSRRLQTEVAEWGLQLTQPLAASTIAWAHSLAGSSATVGFHALSDVARAFEHSLLRTQSLAWGTQSHAQAYNDAAEEIRRLLHQFAAGFLKQPDPSIVDALHAVDRLEIPRRPVPADELLYFPDDEDSQAQASPGLVHAGPPPGEAPAPGRAADAPLAWQSAGPVPSLDDEREGIDAVDVIDPDLFPVFEDEAAELLPQLGAALRQWAARPDNRSARDEVLRGLHTLKGSARLAGALRLGERAHRMESLIEAAPADRVAAASDIEPLLQRFDALQAAFDEVRAAVAGAQAQAANPSELPARAAQAGVQVPPERAGGEAGAGVDAQACPTRLALAPPVTTSLVRHRASASQAVRVRSQVLDRLMNQAGEVMITRSRLENELRQLRGSLDDLTGNLDRLRAQLRDIELQADSQMQSRLAQSREPTAGFDPLEFDRFTRVQELTRMMAESVNDVATVQRNLQRTVDATEDDLAAQARQTRELQRDLLRTRMVEFEAIADRLYRVVRQGAKETGKQVRLDIEGGRIEMDRGVLERMTAAFEHLLRNCVVHGIEDVAVRTAAGKDPTGRIRLQLTQEGNDVTVVFEDDGAGLDLGRIRERALAQGLVRPGQVLSDDEAAQLIFTAGFSTAAHVTELAGRGVGMDVVRAECQALGGRIDLATAAGQGSRFALVLPLTTAVTQVVMVRCGALRVGVPANLVEVVRRAGARELQQAYNSGRFEHDGEAVPFFWSGALLQESRHSIEPQGRSLPVLVFRSAAQRVAVHVDEVLGHQEVVVKHLGPQLARLPGLAGMTVLASGAVVLIYNPVALAAVYGERARALSADLAQPEVLERAAGGTGTELLPNEAAAQALAQVPLVLVVDDSITVRRVTQRLLEREGYRVAVAADGLQALERLAQERPALVLSDIEMPRMDGFDLVRNLRGDPRWSGLPVVMITSRIAAKHREHAAALGVNHYLGKPYSEEELLALVRRYAVPQAMDADT